MEGKAALPHLPVLAEQVAQILLLRIKGEVADVKGHSVEKT
jgi:hypothetical protein